MQEWRRNNAGAEFITGIDYRRIAKARGLGRNRLQEVTDGLERFGWLRPFAGGFQFPEQDKP